MFYKRLHKTQSTITFTQENTDNQPQLSLKQLLRIENVSAEKCQQNIKNSGGVFSQNKFRYAKNLLKQRSQHNLQYNTNIDNVELSHIGFQPIVYTLSDPKNRISVNRNKQRFLQKQNKNNTSNSKLQVSKVQLKQQPSTMPPQSQAKQQQPLQQSQVQGQVQTHNQVQNQSLSSTKQPLLNKAVSLIHSNNQTTYSNFQSQKKNQKSETIKEDKNKSSHILQLLQIEQNYEEKASKNYKRQEIFENYQKEMFTRQHQQQQQQQQFSSVNSTCHQQNTPSHGSVKFNSISIFDLNNSRHQSMRTQSCCAVTQPMFTEIQKHVPAMKSNQKILYLIEKQNILNKINQAYFLQQNSPQYMKTEANINTVMESLNYQNQQLNILKQMNRMTSKVNKPPTEIDLERKRLSSITIGQQHLRNNFVTVDGGNIVGNSMHLVVKGRDANGTGMYKDGYSKVVAFNNNNQSKSEEENRKQLNNRPNSSNVVSVGQATNTKQKKKIISLKAKTFRGQEENQDQSFNSLHSWDRQQTSLFEESNPNQLYQ